MIYYDNIKVIGSDSSGRSIAVVSLWVDSAASLPAANAYQSDGFILGMGSEGNCIDSGDKYRLDSSGAWQITQAGTGTYTKAEIDAIVSRIHATEAEDRAALVDLVDSGNKNRLLYDGIGTPTAPATLTFTFNADLSITVNGSTEERAYVFLQYNAGNIDVKDFANGCIISGVPSGTSGLSLRCNSGTTTYGIDTGEGGLIQYTGTAALRVLIFVNANTTLSNVTVKPMISTKAAWDVSHAYQPYRPSWQEMYDMILALQ